MTRRTVNHPEWRWFYKGSIDDIRLYNRVLPKSQILDLFNENCGFVDVPPGYWAEDAICKIYDEGITTGCSKNPLKYYPLRVVNRAQMAAFLERGIHGGDYTSPPATGDILMMYRTIFGWQTGSSSFTRMASRPVVLKVLRNIVPTEQ